MKGISKIVGYTIKSQLPEVRIFELNKVIQDMDFVAATPNNLRMLNSYKSELKNLLINNPELISNNMKAGELMIGNIVNDIAGNPFKVSAKCILALVQCEIAGEVNLGYNGIHLTKEHLEKAGFELFPWGYVKHEMLIRFSYKPNQKFWIELGNGKRIDFNYVHTLQNFFKLIGHDLIF